MLRPGPVQVEQDDLAGGAGQDGPVDSLAQLGQPLRASPGQRRQGLVAPQHLVAVLQDDAPLVLDELVVLPGVAVDLQVDALGDALRVAQHLARLRVGQPGPLFAGRVLEDQLVFHAGEEDRPARVALPPGAPAQLLVEPAAGMPAGADHVQAAQLGDQVTVAAGPAEADVRAAPGHLGGHGDRTAGPGLGDDGGLLGVVLGVEHGAPQPGPVELAGQPLGFGDVERADQDGPPGGVRVSHQADDRFLFLPDGRVEPVGLVGADARAVRRDHRDLQAVELTELLAGRHRGPRHPADGPVTADQGLDGDGVEDLAALAHGQSLLGLDRGVQAVGPALPPGNPAPGLVDQVDRAVPHDVVHVAAEQRMSVQGHVEPGQRLAVLGRVQVDAAERLFGGSGSRTGQGHVTGVFVDLVVLARVKPGGDPRHLAVGVRAFGRAGQDQRHPRLIDKHRVSLVDQDHIRVAGDQAGDVGDQAVAEHVKAELADRRVGDLRRVGAPPVRRRGGLADPADAHAEQVVDRAHPLGVAAGQVVVHRHHVHRPAALGVPGGGERAAQRLALAGPHLGDQPGKHRERAEHLHVVRPLAECAPRRLAPARADLRVVARRSRRRRQLIVGQPAQPLLMPADLGQQLRQRRQFR